MDHPSDQFLARSALPLDQHRAVDLRDGMDPREDAAHGLRSPNDLARRRGEGKLRTEGFVLLRQVFVLDQLIKLDQKFLGGERLLEVVESAKPHGLHGRLHRAVGGHDDNLLVRPLLLEFVEERQAILAGHAQVGEDDVEERLGQRRTGLEGILRGGNLVTGRLELVLEDGALDALIVNDQDLHSLPGHLRTPRATPSAVG